MKPNLLRIIPEKKPQNCGRKPKESSFNNHNNHQLIQYQYRFKLWFLVQEGSNLKKKV